MKRRCDNRQKGAAAVEFAIILPLLLLLLGGIIEFGIVLYNQHVINNATREGARAGTNPLFKLNEDAPPGKLGESDIITIVEDYCKREIDETTEEYITITFGDNALPVVFVIGAGCDTGDDVTVTATYTYQFLLPQIIKLGTTMVLTSTTTMKMM